MVQHRVLGGDEEPLFLVITTVCLKQYMYPHLLKHPLLPADSYQIPFTALLTALLPPVPGLDSARCRQRLLPVAAHGRGDDRTQPFQNGKCKERHAGMMLPSSRHPQAALAPTSYSIHHPWGACDVWPWGGRCRVKSSRIQLFLSCSYIN